MAGEQEEQGSGRNGAGASDGPATAESDAPSPTDTDVGAAPVPESPVRVDDRRRGPAAAVGVRRAVGTIINLLAVTVRLIGLVLAAILLVRIGLAFVPVNPGNVIVEWIVRFADIIVWGFRDLFLPTDPLDRAGGELRSGRGVLAGRGVDRCRDSCPVSRCASPAAVDPDDPACSSGVRRAGGPLGEEVHDRDDDRTHDRADDQPEHRQERVGDPAEGGPEAARWRRARAVSRWCTQS